MVGGDDRRKKKMEWILFFIYLELFLIYCMDMIFLELFLFVYYCSVVYETLVFQKIKIQTVSETRAHPDYYNTNKTKFKLVQWEKKLIQT